MEYVWKSFSKSYTTTKHTIDRQYTETVGTAVVSTITSYIWARTLSNQWQDKKGLCTEKNLVCKITKEKYLCGQNYKVSIVSYNNSENVSSFFLRKNFTWFRLTDFQDFADRTSSIFPWLSSPGKCDNKIPRLTRISRTRTNPMWGKGAAIHRLYWTYTSVKHAQ